jgi:hypothetical protein
MALPSTVQAEVDTLAADLSHPVLVEDAQHHPLWWSAQGDVDTVRVRTLLQREPGPDALALVARLGLAKAQGPVRTPAVPEADMLPRWCVPLRSRGDLLGYLWVLDADGTVGEQDLPKLIHCANTAIDCLETQRPDPERRLTRRTELLERLSRGRDLAAADELMLLENLRAGSTVAVYARSATSSEWPVGPGFSVRVNPESDAPATSGPPVALADLHVAVRRASDTARAIRAGARLERPTWDALGSWHLIVQAPADLRVSDVHPGAQILADLTRDELLVTARSVLDAGGDVARAAKELHIHRTTLYYRIERIEKLTGVNLKVGPDRDDLHLALRLAAFRQTS